MCVYIFINICDVTIFSDVTNLELMLLFLGSYSIQADAGSREGQNQDPQEQQKERGLIVSLGRGAMYLLWGVLNPRLCFLVGWFLVPVSFPPPKKHLFRYIVPIKNRPVRCCVGGLLDAFVGLLLLLVASLLLSFLFFVSRPPVASLRSAAPLSGSGPGSLWVFDVS